MIQRPCLIAFTYPSRRTGSATQISLLEKIKPAWSDRIDFEIVRVWDQLEYAAAFGVWFVPATILLDANQQVVRVNADVLTEAQLCEQFVQVLAQPRAPGSFLAPQRHTLIHTEPRPQQLAC